MCIRDRGKEIRNAETGVVSTDLSGQKVVMGGGIFVVPFVQRLHVLLSLIHI